MRAPTIPITRYCVSPYELWNAYRARAVSATTAAPSTSTATVGRSAVNRPERGGGVSVVFNVSTPDASSFRKSEAQVTGMLARAVSRGTRSL